MNDEKIFNVVKIMGSVVRDELGLSSKSVAVLAMDVMNILADEIRQLQGHAELAANQIEVLTHGMAAQGQDAQEKIRELKAENAQISNIRTRLEQKMNEYRSQIESLHVVLNNHEKSTDAITKTLYEGVMGVDDIFVGAGVDKFYTAVKAERKIDAIRALRELYPVKPEDAKDIVEKIYNI